MGHFPNGVVDLVSVIWTSQCRWALVAEEGAVRELGQAWRGSDLWGLFSSWVDSKVSASVSYIPDAVADLVGNIRSSNLGRSHGGGEHIGRALSQNLALSPETILLVEVSSV